MPPLKKRRNQRKSKEDAQVVGEDQNQVGKAIADSSGNDATGLQYIQLYWGIPKCRENLNYRTLHPVQVAQQEQGHNSQGESKAPGPHCPGGLLSIPGT
mgnify:CR=1 FL=1